jgi:hypothetical protein
MAAVTTGTAPRGLGRTARRDAWWLPPALTVLGLTVFTVYSVFAILSDADYRYTGNGADYLSPFYSPDLESLLGISVPFSPALLVVWAPLGLRATCYYYRKAYYKAFFLAPPGCAVAGPKRKRYRGEASFPFVLQNVHRYFLYLALVVLGFLWYDAGRAFFFETADGSLEFGIGLGSLVLLGNVVFLSAFTLGCNSLRHLVGGNLDCFTCSASARARHSLWRRVTRLNLRHMEWAWISLVGVGLADLYVRLAASGVIDDPRII